MKGHFGTGVTCIYLTPFAAGNLLYNAPNEF
jgi:hypothetical protein